MLAPVTVFDKVPAKLWIRSSRDRKDLVDEMLKQNLGVS